MRFWDTTRLAPPPNRAPTSLLEVIRFPVTVVLVDPSPKTPSAFPEITLWARVKFPDREIVTAKQLLAESSLLETFTSDDSVTIKPSQLSLTWSSMSLT